MNGECDYPPYHEMSYGLKTEDHPIECTTCEVIVHALENWLIDPTDEQTVKALSNYSCISLKMHNRKSKRKYIFQFHLFLKNYNR